MSRRGFTLLELVIVIGLIIGLSALVLTDMGERLEAGRFEAAGRALESCLVMARSDAQREGRPFAVVTRPVAARVGVYVDPFDPRLIEDSTPREDDVAPGKPRVVLAERVRVVDRLPAVESPSWAPDQDRPETADELWEAAARAPSVVNADGGPLVLAVFLPDGTAWSPGRSYLVTGSPDRLKAVSLVVNRWTGAISLRPVSLNQDEGGGTDHSDQADDADAKGESPDDQAGGTP